MKSVFNYDNGIICNINNSKKYFKYFRNASNNVSIPYEVRNRYTSDKGKNLYKLSIVKNNPYSLVINIYKLHNSLPIGNIQIDYLKQCIGRFSIYKDQSGYYEDKLRQQYLFEDTMKFIDDLMKNNKINSLSFINPKESHNMAAKKKGGSRKRATITSVIPFVAVGKLNGKTVYNKVTKRRKSSKKKSS